MTFDPCLELRCADLQACGSETSLNSNGSLPGPQSHRRLLERRVASWAVSFERLLQDPVGVRYFSVSASPPVVCTSQDNAAKFNQMWHKQQHLSLI